jgi:hypothetical protein
MDTNLLNLSTETVVSSLLNEIFIEPANHMRSETEEEIARCNGGCGAGCFAAR